ncbi:GNAT family N-acetyltransferase [Bradyrhizobium sp. LA6.12]|uniref:GNAT family N-acetyltransferase n=1 Tax=unclassified Bradyrhizobium TaxID=2631580 RepID=UPI00339A8789
MIRSGMASDRGRAVELLRHSHAAAGFDGTGESGFAVPFEAPYATRLFEIHLGAMNGCCFVLDVDGEAQGILLALAYEHQFGPVWISRESAWWIEPAHRGRSAVAMLDAYEAWSREKRCRFVGMAGMGADPDVAKLYERRGYRRAETHFLKAV